MSWFSFPLPGVGVILRPMRTLRGVGAVAVAAVAVVTGCGGGNGEGEAGAKASSSPTVSAVPEPVPTVEESVYPVGPEGDIDQLADERGWVVDGLYDSASAFVQDICVSLPVSAVDGSSRPQWLAESGNFDGDGAEVLKVGIPKLCPKWSKTLREAVSGDYDRWFGDGTYVVSSKPPSAEEADVETMPPGTYRAKGRMVDCYWERTSKGGEIIDNRMATSAQEITVTVRPSDGQFTAERCAVWKPVK